MSDGPVLEAQAVAKGYPSGGRRLEVLRDLDFSVGPGEVVAIVGASGVGKSTLLHLLGGIDRPDAGRILHQGRDLTSLDDLSLARFRNREVGFVFQFHYLLPEFTALENVMMPRRVRGERGEAVRRLARDLLAEMGIADRAHHRPGELSGGEQQRVAIARALAAEPGVVLADEPTGNLDAVTGEQVFEAFAARLRERRLTTILVTHNEGLAARAGRVFELRAGRLQPGPGGAGAGSAPPGPGPGCERPKSPPAAADE
jgi:lipoprotein-releasing system ATP-binding protein